MTTMTAAAIKSFGIGTGARRLSLDPDTGEPLANADDDGGTIDSNTAGALIDRQAKAMAAEQGISYQQALHRVLAHPDNGQLVAIYNHRVGPGETLVAKQYAQPVDDPAARNMASVKLHNLIVAHLQRNPTLTYREAAAEVCAAPETSAATDATVQIVSGEVECNVALLGALTLKIICRTPSDSPPWDLDAAPGTSGTRRST